MTVNTHQVLSSTFQNTLDLGRKASTADAVLVIHSAGMEKLQLLVKQFPWPVATVKDAMEFFGPNGQAMAQPQNNKTKFEGPVAIYEVQAGTVGQELVKLIEAGAVFDATAYAGRPDDHAYSYDIKGAFMVMDTPDRDWENDTALLLAGTLHFHWFANQ
ncbi:hypothetical protein C1893_23150 [Pseudomonas sp. MPR-ANC1]|uniref:hypothetical protein n=1 Tax=Pseudomonas sp. MPR-ANC1 TaxID=2075548 RepID=UPI000CCFFA66|nr:hypothetical protein [Pseudomonas sp. MPR-ANC1]POA45556.1 hypothetical protein C1893_23150 [Pseudomonas sp. MPR-ANC1]